MRSSNPALNEKVWQRAGTAESAESMTLGGTIGKTAILLALAIFSASYTWGEYASGNTGILMPAFLIGGLGGLAVAILTVVKPRVVPMTAPLYAVLKGLLLGAISAHYNALYPGLPPMAVGLTFMTLAGMLVLYRTRIIRVTDTFRTVIVAATLAIMLFYLVSIVLGMVFGIGMPLIHDTGALGIGFSLFVVGIAALNLALDFDLIERGVQGGAPKFMEWYGAFALIVTLIWLYLEILRLLGKLRR